eukprot:scaffold377067_cov28-Prasinocladus_malaysianus.AAC.2
MGPRQLGHLGQQRGKARLSEGAEPLAIGAGKEAQPSPTRESGKAPMSSSEDNNEDSDYFEPILSSGRRCGLNRLTADLPCCIYRWNVIFSSSWKTSKTEKFLRTDYKVCTWTSYDLVNAREHGLLVYSFFG